MVCTNIEVTTYQFCARPFELKKKTEKSGVLQMSLYQYTYITNFEGLIMYKNIRRPCYVSEMAYSCQVPELSANVFKTN